MLPRRQTLYLALATALLIIFGLFGIFTAEASSFKTTVIEAQTHGTVLPLDPYDPNLADFDAVTLPGMPY
jgi:hypothetical protein